MLDRYLNCAEFSSWEDFRERFRIVVPDDFNFAFDVVDEIAARDPDRLALVWCNEAHEERRVSFGEMARRTNHAANFLKRLGIGKGDPVMLMLKRRHHFWPCLLALHKLGAVAIPATHLLTAKDVAYRNNAASIKAIICVPEPRVLRSVEDALGDSPSVQHLITIDEKVRGWLNLDEEAAGESDEFPRPTGAEATCSADPLVTYFTSGTTGLPKMVQHSHSYPLGHILTAKWWQCVREGGLHLTVADTGWAKTAWGKIYGQWLCGSAVLAYDADRFDPHCLLQVVADQRVTTFCAPPTVYRYLIREDFSRYDLSGLEYCVVAGEPLEPEIYHTWLANTGLRLMEGYGQTETVVTVANYPWFEPRPGSMGRPSPGWDVDLVDDEGNPCDVDEPGRIIIRIGENPPVGMFTGYFRDPELTHEVYHDGVYHTGDLAWRDKDGYYWFMGRADDIIKTSGYRVGPFEIESVLLEHPAVVECAVTGAPDEMRGQVVKATCVLAPGLEASEELAAELREHVKGSTAAYKYPRIIEFVDALPKTISGKVRRGEIRGQQDG